MSEEQYLQFGIPDVPFSAVRVPIDGEAAVVAANLEIALKTAAWFHAKFIAAFPSPARPEPAQRPQGARSGGGGRPQQQQRRGGGGGGTSRADRFEQTDGECDICGGPVGIYPRTGNMRSDKIVCLGKCKDDEYVHTVAWMDEASDDGYQEPDSMPF